jgi:hypothetical protein
MIQKENTPNLILQRASRTFFCSSFMEIPHSIIPGFLTAAAALPPLFVLPYS